MVVPLAVAFTVVPVTEDDVLAPAEDARGIIDPFRPITALCEACDDWSTATGW